MKTLRTIVLLVFLLSIGFTSTALAQDSAPNAPETINTFTIAPNPAAVGTTIELNGTYDLANAGTDMVAFCFYFATADFASWDANFTSLDSDAFLVFTKNGTVGYCPAVAGFGRLGFYASDTSSAVFGDNFRANLIVPNIALGNKIVAVRQYEGLDCDGSTGVGTDTPGSAGCPFVNFRSVTNFVVQAPPAVVYAGAVGCESQSPCYTSMAGAYTAVATGGEIRVVASMPAENLTVAKDVTILDYDGTGALTGAAGNEVIRVTGGNVVVQNLSISAGAATNLFRAEGGSLTVKGNDLTGGSLVFDMNLGSVAAYANNITGYTQGTGGAGSFDGRHNWWGAAATELGVGSADAWTYRLGADIFAWGEGSLGGASIYPETATGTGVVISHGRGESNAPFGKATTADGNIQCSDYYDFFAAPGATAGNWSVEIPIDAGTGCDLTYNERQVFAFDLGASGEPNTACVTTACWEDLKDTVGETLVQLGRSTGIRWSTASTDELAGTPVVSGNQDGNDPTAIVLKNMEATSPSVWVPVSLIAALLVAAVGLLVFIRRKVGGLG